MRAGELFLLVRCPGIKSMSEIRVSTVGLS